MVLKLAQATEQPVASAACPLTRSTQTHSSDTSDIVHCEHAKARETAPLISYEYWLLLWNHGIPLTSLRVPSSGIPQCPRIFAKSYGSRM